jgi:hypothetical protein
MWILQKPLYEGKETCQNGLYVCVFTPLHQYEGKIRTTAGDILKYFVNCWKQSKVTGKENKSSLVIILTRIKLHNILCLYKPIRQII